MSSSLRPSGRFGPPFAGRPKTLPPPSRHGGWYNGLVKKIDTLRRHPTRCPLAAENDKFPEEIRELLYGRSGKRIHKHRILFTVREDTVHILYVRHTDRDELEP